MRWPITVLLALVPVVPLAAAAQGPATELPPSVAQKMSKFYDGLRARNAEQALYPLYGGGPNEEAWERNVFSIAPELDNLVRTTPVTGYEIVKVERYGEKLLRVSMLLDVHLSAYAFVLIFYWIEDDWFIESLCMESDLEDATESGDGRFICP